MYRFDKDAYNKRVDWFRKARFGMFIHWGLYSLPGRGEWVRSDEQMPEEAYLPYFEAFTARDFDPVAWANTAKNAGMEYVVMTAKHHDGFCLFDSALTDFKSTNTPFGRDAVAEFVEAVRGAGLKVGLYFSLIDWHHPDYPHYGDRYHPMRNNPAYENSGRDFDRYLDFMHGQIREICTNYGKLDLLWFDFAYGDLRGDAWRGTELVNTVRSLQPGVLIDNRIEVSGEGFGSLYRCEPAPYHGDFVTPEKFIPPQGIRDVQGEPMVWESCVTMNNNWGYYPEDRNFKPAGLLIKKLVECVSKGGNMILNVGPDGDGNIPPESVEILAEIGSWMARNGDSIHSCGMSGLEKPEYGRITRNGNTLYIHIFENTLGPLPLMGLKKEQVESLRLLDGGKPVPISTSWVHSDYPEILFADLGSNPVLPDPVDTVLEVRLKG